MTPRRPTLSFVDRDANLLNIKTLDVSLPNAGRLYLATELPYRVTDRLTVSLEGDWTFSGSGREMDEAYSGALAAAARQWDADGTLHWVSADFLVSYALIKDAALIKDLSVVAGLRWDYQINELRRTRASPATCLLDRSTRSTSGCRP